MTGRTLLRQTIQANFTTDPTARPIVASGKVVPIESYRYPVEPPREWFTRQEFDGPTPTDITPDGRVTGHVVEWGKRHIAYGGRAIFAPKSRSKYAHYLTGHVLCDDGSRVATGPVYIDCDHADLELNSHQARDFMAHTGSAVADVAVFEDRFGIQIAGSVRPDASPAQVRTFRGSDLSGDWRPQEGGHEMVGLVCVNTSGFIVKGLVAHGGLPGQDQITRVADGRPRWRWDHDDDAPLAMVAVGMVRHAPPDPMEELRAEVQEMREFFAHLKADQVMSRFSGSMTVSALEERAASVMGRLQS